MTAMRWLVLIPAAVVGWWAIVVLAIALHSLVFSFCPAEDIVSGACVAPWFMSFESGLLYASAALSAVVVIMLATIIAPKWRSTIALISLFVGALVAFALGGPLAETIVACVAGLVTALVMCSLYARNVA